MDDETRSPDQTKVLERLEYVETVLRDAIARLYAIERRLGIIRPSTSEAVPPPQPSSETPPSPRQVPRTVPVIESPATPTPETVTLGGAQLLSTITQPSPPTATTTSPTGPVISAAARDDGDDLELRIGGSWFNRIGIAAICFGVAFFLKYAFENEWIGPGGRVIIGAAIGLGFLAAGERLRSRGYQSYGYGLSGGGTLILYLSAYAAFNFYSLVSQPIAFMLMSLVTVTAALLSARYGAIAIAVIGLIGGFLTPILLSTGIDNEPALFGYIALLDAGVLALAYAKQWRSLNYLAFTATVLMISAWMGEWYQPEKLRTTVFFLTLFFAIFALLAVLYSVLYRRRTHWLDLGLVFLNAVLYFGTTYELLDEQQLGGLGLFAVMMSGFYLGLGYFTIRRDREDRLLVLTFLGLAFLFIVIAVPIQLDQQWVAMAWAIEGAVMTWIGTRTGDRISRYAALIVFLIAIGHWFAVDISDTALFAGDHFVPILNRRALSCGILIASLMFAARSMKSHPEGDTTNTAATGLFLAANLLAVTLLTIDANDYFDQIRKRAVEGSIERISRIGHWRQFTLSALWIIYGTGALLTGLRANLKYVRVAAMLLLGLATAKVVTVDMSFYAASWHLPLLNDTFAAAVLVILALSLGRWAYRRWGEVAQRERTLVVGVMLVVTNFVAVLALTTEASGYFERGAAGPGLPAGLDRDLELAARLSLSLVWTVYGGTMLALGILRRSAVLRIMALVLLSMTIIKVFLVDLASLDRVYRIISFIALGAILLGVSFLYQRYRRQDRAASTDAEPHRERAVS
jgi:uncharacterized membrane protein